MGFLGKIREKLRFQHGQHLIEYSILLTLVMAGIITMSRYVIRSWNANLQGWDDSIIDSQEDSRQTVDYTLPGCPIPDWVDQGCGGGQFNYCTGDQDSCPEVERRRTRAFSPAGCNCSMEPSPPAIDCIIDECCCIQPVVTGICGDDAEEIGDDPPLCNTHGMVPKNVDGTCNPEWEEAWTRCGTDDDTIQQWGCIQTEFCAFKCTIPPEIWFGPEYDQGGGSYCPGDLPPEGGDAPNFYVLFEVGCTDARYCEIQCAEDYYPLENNFICGPCPNPGIEKVDQDKEPDDPDPFCSDNPFDGLPRFWFGDSCDQGEWEPCCPT